MATRTPALTVPDITAWSNFLTVHGSTSRGVILTLARKNHTIPTQLTRQQALEEALCHGWIDGVAGRYEPAREAAYTQRFTPRTARSRWSKINVELVDRLESQGRMRDGGRKVVEEAKADGRWEKAYAPPSRMQVPDDLTDALAASEVAREAWEKLGKGGKYAIFMQIDGLKTAEGRRRKIGKVVEALGRGEGVVKTPGTKTSTTAKVKAKTKTKTNELESSDSVVIEPALKKTRSGRIVRPAST